MKKSDAIVALSDLFGIATEAVGEPEYRDGHSVLGVLSGRVSPRETLFACYGAPGTPLFKAMIRKGDHKYIYLANGGREQLFCLKDDPNELSLLDDESAKAELRAILKAYCARDGLRAALDEGGRLLAFPYTPRPLFRIRQFDASSGVHDFTFQHL